MSTDGSMNIFRADGSANLPLPKVLQPQQSQQPQKLADDLIQQQTQEVAVNKPPEVQNSATENKNDEAIINFAREFQNILTQKLLKEIEPYEQERKKRLVIANIGTFILILLAGLFLILSIKYDVRGDCVVYCIAGAVAFRAWLKKSFENKIKPKIMPKLMEAFPGFYWQQTPAISREEINNIKIFPNVDRIRPTFDDSFYGNYRGVEINLAECCYKIHRNKQTVIIFEGVVIRLKMNKNFEGLTILRPRSQTDNDLKRLEKVTLEDPEFEKQFKTFSTDQIESRYLLTTAFMQRLKDINFAFHSTSCYCAFFNQYVYIAPVVYDDLFSLFNLKKPVTDMEQFKVMFNQIVSILKLIDHFKLDKKLGL